MARGFLTYSSALVLQAIAGGYRYGFDIMDITGLPSGTVYPALRKLERDGLVKSHWESDRTARREQRPARRYYIITGEGSKALTEVLKRFRGIERILPAEQGAS